MTTLDESKAREAGARRAREIREGVLNDKELMEQVRKSAEQNAPRIPWRKMQAKVRERDQ